MPDKSNLIVAQELGEALAEGTCRVIDCRFSLADPEAGRRAYDAAHIPGAVFCDLERDLSGSVGPSTGRHPLPDPDRLAQMLGERGIGNDDEVIVYDADNGALASRTWWLLRWLGHDRVRLLDGGFSAWQKAGLPSEDAAHVPGTSRFTVRLRPEMVVTTEELAALGGRIPGDVLVDARDAVRYHGELEPIDPVAGHIPGALNLPFDRLVNDDGTWRDARQRGAILRDVLGDDKGRAWMVMCGSGVTACHLALAGLEAGYREPRLYVGSWSEWIRDPARPRVGISD
jgi:thiosulfate/3-mercaptopyruvate sulfurtransferase